MKMSWKQLTVEHCPNIECKGMLLIHPMYHEKKCTDCGKYFMSMTETIECPPPKEIEYQKENQEESMFYKKGYDAGLNGANTDNSHFANFSTPEKTKEWEKGNKAGIKDREESEEKPQTVVGKILKATRENEHGMD